MGDAANKLPDLPPTPTANAPEGFKRTREALGVGAYTTHAGLPGFVTKLGKKMGKFTIANKDEGLTPAKKRERILVVSAVVLGILYFYNNYSGDSASNISSQAPAMEILMKDPGFKDIVERLKKEKNETEMSPEIYREAIKLYGKKQ